MNNKRIILTIICFIFTAITCCSTFTENLYAGQEPGSNKFDTTYDAKFRLRQETFDNGFDFSDVHGLSDGNLFRFRSSARVRSVYDGKWGICVKLTNEARYFMDYPGDAKEWDEDELFFDNLYLSAENVFDLPVDLTLGRQDFVRQYGEGFLIMDGTPLDGSRSAYFNAAKVAVRLAPGHTVDVILLSNPEQDDFLPSMYAGEKRKLNDSDEWGFVLYGKHAITETLSFDSYYIYKEEEHPDMIADFTETDLALHSIGARTVFTAGGNTFRAEIVGQFGDYASGMERKALGGYAFMTRRYDAVTLKPKAEIGVVYLSGDDPETVTKDEGFNPLFSRWPWLSELLVYTLAPERGLTYWTNLAWYRAGLKLTLSPKTHLNLRYNYLRALQDTGSPFSVDGKNERGHLIQARLGHRFSKKTFAYLLVEYMAPGDHYLYDDGGVFTRWELSYSL